MTEHPIDPFLAVWSSRKGRDGIDLRMRVYSALTADGDWTRERLRVTLRALVAFGAEEQRRFDECFAEFFSSKESPDWLRERLDTTLDRNLALAELSTLTTPATSYEPTKFDVVSPSNNSPKKVIIRRPVVVALATAAALVSTGGFVWYYLHKSPPSAQTEQVTPVPAPMPTRVVTGTETVTTREEVHPQQIGRVRDAPGALVTMGAVLAMLLIVATLTLADVSAFAWTIRPIKAPDLLSWEQPPRDATLAERQVNYRSPLPLESPLSSESLDRLALRTGFALDAAQPEFDLRATVLATARAGGLLDPVYRPGRRTTRLRVSRPRQFNPVASAVLDAFTQGMRARGVSVVDVVEFPDETPSDINLVVIDAIQWSARYREAWRRVPHVAYIEARDPAHWDSAVERLPFGVFTLDAGGLSEAIDAARNSQFVMPVERVRLGDPKERLGEAFPLAAACSFLGLFDLATIDRLRRSITPDVPFLCIQRVLALDGVSGGPTQWKMTPELRAWFDAAVPQGAPLRDAVLAWQRERLCSLKSPPQGSRAEFILQMQTLWVDLLHGFRSPSALASWVDRAERFLGERMLKEVYFAQLRAMPKPKVGEVNDPVLEARLARLGLVDMRPVVALSRTTRVSIFAVLILASAIVCGTAWELFRIRGTTLSVWSGPWSDTLVNDRGNSAEVHCADTELLVGFSEQGAPMCRVLNIRALNSIQAEFRFGEMRSPSGTQRFSSDWTGARGAFCNGVVVGIEGSYGFVSGNFADAKVAELRLRCDNIAVNGRSDEVVLWGDSPHHATIHIPPLQSTLTERTTFWADCRPGGFVRGIRLLFNDDGSLHGVSVKCASVKLAR